MNTATTGSADTNIYLKSIINSKHSVLPMTAVQADAAITTVLSRAEKFAKILRVITVPPVIVSALLILLYALNGGVFQDIYELVFSLLFFGAVPMLAYPISLVSPSLRAKGREFQRSLAFKLTISGYLLAFIYGLAADAGPNLQFIYTTYMFSAIILAAFNKLLHVKASGHACSTVGPLTVAVYYLGPIALIPGIMIAAAAVWSSLKLKRHKLSDLFWGAFVCLPGAILAYLSVFHIL